MWAQLMNGENMRDIADLHASELGEIIWQHKSHQSPEYIAKRLRVKLYQVRQYIKDNAKISNIGDSQLEDYNPPWMMKPLDEWAIVGMNHYNMDGERRLFVAMTKGDKCIQEEGPDNIYMWSRLRHKANDAEQGAG